MPLKWTNLDDLSSGPSARYGHSMVGVGAHSVVLFGGLLDGKLHVLVSSTIFLWASRCNCGTLLRLAQDKK